MALQGFSALVKVQSSAVAMTDEATTGAGNLTYQIDATAKRIIDLNTIVLVEDGGSATTETYSVNYLTGTITFGSAVARVITVTGAYVTPATVETADNFSFSGSCDALENTQFGLTDKTFQGGLVSGTASLSRFNVTDDLFTDDLLAQNYKIIEYYRS